MLKEYLPDYWINLVDVRRIEDMGVFQGCLQHIFSMVKYNADKNRFYEYINNHRKEIQKMDHVEQMAALTLLGEQKRLARVMDGEGSAEEEMCKAIDDLIEEGRKEGKAESILVLLGELGLVPLELSDKIRGENDSEVMTGWLKLAAKAGSLEQFVQEMQPHPLSAPSARL